MLYFTTSEADFDYSKILSQCASSNSLFSRTIIWVYNSQAPSKRPILLSSSHSRIHTFKFVCIILFTSRENWIVCTWFSLLYNFLALQFVPHRDARHIIMFQLMTCIHTYSDRYGRKFQLMLARIRLVYSLNYIIFSLFCMLEFFFINPITIWHFWTYQIQEMVLLIPFYIIFFLNFFWRL